MKNSQLVTLSIFGIVGLIILYLIYGSQSQAAGTSQAENEAYLSQTTTSQNLALMKASQQVSASQASSSNSGGSMGSIMSIVGMVAAML